MSKYQLQSKPSDSLTDKPVQQPIQQIQQEQQEELQEQDIEITVQKGQRQRKQKGKPNQAPAQVETAKQNQDAGIKPSLQMESVQPEKQTPEAKPLVEENKKIDETALKKPKQEMRFDFSDKAKQEVLKSDTAQNVVKSDNDLTGQQKSSMKSVKSPNTTVKEDKEAREKRLMKWKTEEDKLREEFKNTAAKVANKPLSVIFSGHVDHGKSSMSGHILVNLQKIDERAMQKLKLEASKMVGESWAYAFAMDACQEEREKGKTVESARATFETPSGRRVVLLDSPGHKGFISSMIESAAQADVAVLVTSARKGEFEAGLERSGQTAEHALILYMSGVRQLIVTVNKMDDPTCCYSQDRYNQIVAGLTTYLTKSAGFAEKNIQFVPVSALTGENLTSKLEPGSTMAKWYQGKCLIEMIDEIKIPKRDLGGFARACVSGKYRDQGYFAVSKVEKGVIRKDETYVLMPGAREFKVLAIEDEVGNQIEMAQAGENCRIQITDEAFEQVGDGSCICDKAHPCETASAFVVKFACVDCPTVLSQGFAAVAHVNTSVVQAKIRQVLGLLDPQSGKLDKSGTTFVKPGQQALIEFECDRPICVNKYADEDFLGRVMLRREMVTVGFGTVVKVCYE